MLTHWRREPAEDEGAKKKKEEKRGPLKPHPLAGSRPPVVFLSSGPGPHPIESPLERKKKKGERKEGGGEKKERKKPSSCRQMSACRFTSPHALRSSSGYRGKRGGGGEGGGEGSQPIQGGHHLSQLSS